MRQAIRDASNQLGTMGAAELAVLQTATHHRTRTAMPKTMCFGQHKLNTTLNYQ